MASNVISHLDELKQLFINLLKDNPDGILKHTIWRQLQDKTGLEIHPQQYNLTNNIVTVFELWKEDIEEIDTKDGPILHLRKRTKIKPVTSSETELATAGINRVEEGNIAKMIHEINESLRIPDRISMGGDTANETDMKLSETADSSGASCASSRDSKGTAPSCDIQQQHPTLQPDGSMCPLPLLPTSSANMFTQQRQSIGFGLNIPILQPLRPGSVPVQNALQQQQNMVRTSFVGQPLLPQNPRQPVRYSQPPLPLMQTAMPPSTGMYARLMQNLSQQRQWTPPLLQPVVNRLPVPHAIVGQSTSDVSQVNQVNNMYECKAADKRNERESVIDQNSSIEKPKSANHVGKKEFAKEDIFIKPELVRRGEMPSKTVVDDIARDCIDILVNHNEFVTASRVNELLLRRFGVHSISNIGYNTIDSIPCILELNRAICRINEYLTAFTKTRSMFTLYEFREYLREFVPNKEDFSKLKLGPLQRFPEIYRQFKFPPDQEEIPVITSADLLDHMDKYLTKNNRWTSRLELEDFMNYLVDEYNAENAYYLGVKIKSLPLAITVLKKSKRDASANRRQVLDHFKMSLETEIDDAFRKFRVSVMQQGDDGMEVRRHYLKMKANDAIIEIFDKFNVLRMIEKPTTTGREQMLLDKSVTIFEEFVKVLKMDKMCKMLFHLAICISSTSLEEHAIKFLASHETRHDARIEETQTQPPPSKADLLKKFQEYVDRSLTAGSRLQLCHLERIEEKLLEVCPFPAFNGMGYGTFLNFVLKEAKHVLEESGGDMLGPGMVGSGSTTDVTFKPHQADILEFIKQGQQCGVTQTQQLEEALCIQYGVKDCRQLGHGSFGNLLKLAVKSGQSTCCTVVYETAMVARSGVTSVKANQVGVLGDQSRYSAKACLHNCPLLADLAEWSQWGTVFEPQHGRLRDFVQKYGGVTTQFEDGKIVTFDIVAMETKPGHLIKITGNTSPAEFTLALVAGDVTGVCGHLVSQTVSNKGVENLPAALLAGHMTTALHQMHATDLTDTPGAPQPLCSSTDNQAARFVLQCLVMMPTRICLALANQMFLEPLGKVMGSTRSKRDLLAACCRETERTCLLELGSALGVNEWSDTLSRRCQVPDTAVESIPQEQIEEFFTMTDEEEEESVSVVYESQDELELSFSDVEIELGETESITTVEDTPADKRVEEGPSEDTEDKPNSDDSQNLAPGATNTDTIAVEEVPTCQNIINQIRRDEFGIGVDLNEDGKRLMNVQQERLGRSLQRLSKDLYSKDTHFVLELVQNADDNSYDKALLDSQSGECPAVTFYIEETGITVMNNELGFQEKHIRALCDVGRSTKGKHEFGYIGQKGIGFKSVFRVTDCPEVHSAGFHIMFDVHSGPSGYILPHWVNTDASSDNSWMTRIVLPVKPDVCIQTLSARFHDMHPSMLLFLHRIRQITVENKIEKSIETMRRYDVGDSVVEIKHSGGRDRWLVIKKSLDASKISLQAKAGVDVSSTEIALAFPLRSHGQTSISQALPPKQPVFAFLPLRSYGFRFIVQGDFDVPSSREDVVRDSSWNQWLKNEIHTLFLDSLDVFKSHPAFSDMEAIVAFLQFVPMQDEVLDFFKPVADKILTKLKARPCVPTQPNSQGVVSWKIPSQTVQVRDPLVREIITGDLLQKHLDLFYLHSDVAAMLSVTLTSCLGIVTLTAEHMFKLGKAIIVSMGSHCDESDVTTIARWLACMYRSLDDFQQNDEILKTIKAARLLPLSTGELVALSEKTVFFPIVDDTPRTGRDPLYHLQQDIHSLHPTLVTTEDDEVNSQVQKLLQRLDIKQLSPLEVINHHILPVLESDDWQQKSRDTLVAYIIYIKEQTDKRPSLCDLSKLKDVAQLVTNHGLRNPNQEPVHFTPLYGNQVDLAKKFKGYDWVLIDACYLPPKSTQVSVHSWHDFFAKLGVEDFISVRQKTVHLNQDNIVQSPWAEQQKLWPTVPEFVIKDWHSPELVALIEHNDNADTALYRAQMQELCTLLGRYWDTRFSRYTATHMMDKELKCLGEIETSFSILLRTASWLPAVHTQLVVTDNGTVDRKCEIIFKQPSHLYIRSDVVQTYLAETVLYLDGQVTNDAFGKFLELKRSVTMETVKGHLLQWSEREEPDEPATFCTNLEHMKNIYFYLSRNLTKQDLQDLLRSKPIYFVPSRIYTGNIPPEKYVSGQMLRREEIWIADNTGLFEKHIQLLQDLHCELHQKRTVVRYYPDNELLDMFKYEAKVDVQPKLEEYLELLNLLCTANTPKDPATFADVLYIFTTIGRVLSTPPAGMPDEETAEMALAGTRNAMKREMEKQKMRVLPTKKKVWVSLDECPLIADNREWEKMFSMKEDVHFLDVLEQKKSRISAKFTRDIVHIQPDMVDVFINVCGLRRLSECVKIEPTPEMIEQCPLGQLYVHQVAPLIQLFLMEKHPDVYQQLHQHEAKTMLESAKFYQAQKLEVIYRLLHLKKGVEPFEVCQEKCVISPPMFYFHRDHVDATLDINRELARHFSCGRNECNTALRSFLGEVAVVMSNTTDSSVGVDRLLQDYYINVDIQDDECWQVEAPYIPEPEPEPEPLPEPVTPEVDTPPEVTPTAKDQSGEFQLRSWPPVANQSGGGGQRTEGNKPSKSNIWPPPDGKDYMKSVTELPSTIKVLPVKTEPAEELTKGDKKLVSDTPRVAGPDSSRGLSQGTAPTPKPQPPLPMSTATADQGTVTTVTTETEVKPRSRSEASRTAGESRKSRELTDSASADKGVKETNVEDAPKLAAADSHTPRDRSSVKRDHSASGRPGKRLHLPDAGHPVWASMTSDYTYEELGRGVELPIPSDLTLTLDDDAGDPEVGRWGEGFVYEYLQREKERGNIQKVMWMNSDVEAYRPYDVVILTNKGHTVYIEVKATSSDSKSVFNVSIQQLMFAEEKRRDFHIYRVYNAGNAGNVMLCRIRDVMTKLVDKKVRLCMLI